MKRKIALLLTVVMFSFTTIPSTAAATIKPKLIDVKNVPSGVIPIELDSDDLETFINIVTNENESDSINTLKDISRVANSTVRTEYILQSISFDTTMYAKIDTDKNNKISKVHGMGVSMTGFSPGIDISNITTSYSVNSSKKTVTLYYDYDKNYYLLVDGLIKLFTTGYSAQYSFTVDKGCHDETYHTY